MPRIQERNGLRIARLFRQARGLTEDQRTCDLALLRAEDSIDLVVSDLANPGYTACLVRPGPDLPCGIILAQGQSRGRERFSIAHELGHFYMPTHKDKPMGWCGEEDMTARAGSGKQYEWEANDFAAELLMPRRPFQSDAQGRDPIFRDLVELADPGMYDVSVTAAALRYVEVTSEACALVCSRAGAIEWVAKSDAFRYRVPWRGDALPGASVARAVCNGAEPNDGAETLDPYVWLEVEHGDSLEVFESTLSIPSQGQVLSLVWVVAEDSGHDD
ncbi:MAG: ImmA/IrrE family metallo-endopeptidase [Longimicrobiales bacterium]